MLERRNRKWDSSAVGDTALDWWGDSYTPQTRYMEGASALVAALEEEPSCPQNCTAEFMGLYFLCLSRFERFRTIIVVPECQWDSLKGQLGLPDVLKPQTRSLHKSTLYITCSEFNDAKPMLKSFWLCCIMPHTQRLVWEVLITKVTSSCSLLFICKPMTSRQRAGSAAGGFRLWSHNGLGAGSQYCAHRWSSYGTNSWTTALALLKTFVEGAQSSLRFPVVEVKHHTLALDDDLDWWKKIKTFNSLP